MALLARLTPSVQLAACCDLSGEVAEAFARRYRIRRWFTDYEELLSQVPAAAVYLAVPHHLHFKMIKAAVDQGRPVLAEKPITRTLAEGREIVAYAREKGVRIGVNYQYRYDRGCFKLAHLAHTGQLGRLLYARANVPWHRERGYFETAAWHKTLAEAGGGTLITQASHLVDIMLWVTGSSPVAASGMTDRKVFTEVEVEDFAVGTVKLKNGAVLQITTSMVAASEQPVTLEVYGERATAVYTDKPWPRVKLIPGKSAGPRAASESGGHPDPDPLVVNSTGRVPYFGFHALHRCLKGFRDWVLHDRPFLVPGEAALPVLAVVEAIYLSAQEGRWVDISSDEKR